ncbi:ABC transporter substrate-binding protein [Ningiella sp. W23]|uniref:ABC transporter substrate-binding protein n=1 Tax=Ningiella sp. W23 TaxID=3023715 RepID=UPI0037580BF4
MPNTFERLHRFFLLPFFARMSNLSLPCLILAFCLSLAACQPKQSQNSPITIAIGSWYGYYPLYYASDLGIDEKYGLSIKVLEPQNISSFRRIYVNEQVDFVGTSMIEFTNAKAFTKQDIQPVLVSDFSNGGDVVIARQNIQTPEQLKGKIIAVPSNGIGEYFMSLVFDDKEPSQHFKQFIIPETACQQAFDQNTIDACVTYPPISTHLLKNPELHKVLDTSAYPGQIYDLLWSKPHVNAQQRSAIKKVWYETVAAIEADPVAYHSYIAQLADVSVSSAEEAMLGIKLVNEQDMKDMFADVDALNKRIVAACYIAQGENCEKFANAFAPLDM